MTITPVDSKNDLFFVENIYPQNLVDQVMSIDHRLTKSTCEEFQEDYPRKKLYHTHSVYNAMYTYVQSIQTTIEECVQMEFLSCDSAFWLDLPGFDMEKHLDNKKVFAAMQIYLTENTRPMPTVFYNSDDSIRFEPEYCVNSGYLMFNNENQWHAMPYTVPDNEYRLTSYTWFYQKRINTKPCLK